MITALLLVLAQTATAIPAPKLGGGFGLPKPTATAKARIVITDATLAPTGRGRGAFSVAGAPIAQPFYRQAPSTDEDAVAAQGRMDEAARDGYWTAGNITYNQRLLDGARSEWDAAEANCRRTPGCTPNPVPAGVLPTGEETLQKLHKNRFGR